MKTPVEYLFAPGPIAVPGIVKDQMLYDPPYFAGKEFGEIVKRVNGNMKRVFNTKHTVLTGTGSGTLGMEMAVLNFFNPGEKVFVIDGGKYGRNWYEMCRKHNLSATNCVVGAGDTLKEETLEMFVKDSPPISGFFITHVETTTGSLFNLDGYVKVIRKYHQNAIIVVDAVSSLLSEYLNTDNYDVTISASQKGLACPPGLFFMAVSEPAYHKSTNVSAGSFYFSVPREFNRVHDNQTSFTPAAFTYVALDFALEHYILPMGVPEIIEHVRRNSLLCKELLNKAILENIFDAFCTSPSNAVSVVKTSTPAGQILNLLRDEGIVIAGGVRQQAGKILRIMNFGWDTDPEDVEHVTKTTIKIAEKLKERLRSGQR